MKYAICQINTSVGDLKYNYKKIIGNYELSLSKGADLVIFPELTITGYPPRDLLLDKAFIDWNLYYSKKISKQSTKPIIFGFVDRKKEQIYNSLAICYDGKLFGLYNKKLLPNYDIFDEKRYFKSGKESGVFKINYGDLNLTVGLQICEDLWDDDYKAKISEQQKKNGAEIIINCSASPFTISKLDKRVDLIKKKATTLNLPIIYCNQVGAQDEIIFDGNSLIFSKHGDLICQGKSFSECNIITEIYTQSTIKLNIQSKEEKIFNALCLGISDYFSKTGNKDAVLGLSGGIDSALTAAIAVNAIGSENVHGVLMPSKFSSKHSIEDAIALAKNLDMHYEVIPIQNSVDSIIKSLSKSFNGKKVDKTEENIQSRIRGNILMSLANKFDWLLLTTGNKTELALGYCTIYGDMNGSLGVISDLNKLDVYQVAKWYNKNFEKKIPLNSILKPPSAELSKNQIDPYDYEIISPIVDLIIEDKFTLEEIKRISTNYDNIDSLYYKIRNNEFKRYQSAPTLKINDKSFGVGRRYPIVNNFRG